VESGSNCIDPPYVLDEESLVTSRSRLVGWSSILLLADTAGLGAYKSQLDPYFK
jgi:hypothetical protein